jgi:hypothetical protein
MSKFNRVEEIDKMIVAGSSSCTASDLSIPDDEIIILAINEGFSFLNFGKGWIVLDDTWDLIDNRKIISETHIEFKSGGYGYIGVGKTPAEAFRNKALSQGL